MNKVLTATTIETLKEKVRDEVLLNRELLYTKDAKNLYIKDADTNELILIGGSGKQDILNINSNIYIGSVTTQPDKNSLPWKSQFVLFDTSDTTILLTKESAANQQDENSIIGGELLIKFIRDDGTFKIAHYRISLSSTGSYSLEGATGTVDNVEVVYVERDGIGYYGLKMPNDVYQVMINSIETYYEFTKRTETQEWVENAVNDTRENITDNYAIKVLDTGNPNSLVLVNKSTNNQIPLSVANVIKPLLVHKTIYFIINGTAQAPQLQMIGSDDNGNEMYSDLTRRDDIPANEGCFWFSMTMGNYRNITQMPLITGTNLDFFDNNAYIWFELYISAYSEFTVDRAYITRTNQNTVAGVMSEGKIWRSAQHIAYYDNTNGTAPVENGVPATDKSYIDCSVGFILSEYFRDEGGDYPINFGQRMTMYQFDLPTSGDFDWYYVPIRYLLDDRGKGIYESAELKNWYDNDYYLYLNIYYKEYMAGATAYVGCKEGYICNTNGDHNPQIEPEIVVQYLPFANINDVAYTIKNFFTTANTTKVYLRFTRPANSYYITNSTFYLSSNITNNAITLNNGYQSNNYTRWYYYLFDDFVRQLDIPILGSTFAQYFGKGYYLWILINKNNNNTSVNQILIGQMDATGDRPATPYVMGFTAAGNTGNEAYGQVVSFGTLFRVTSNIAMTQNQWYTASPLMTLINLLPYPAQLSQADFETNFMNINYVIGGIENYTVDRSRVINLYDRTQKTKDVEGYSQSWDFYLKRTSGWDFYVSRNNGDVNVNEDIKLDFTDGYAQSGTFRYSCSLDSLLNLCDEMKGNGNLADYYEKGYNLLFEITRQDLVNNWDPTLKDVSISVIGETGDWLYINPAFEDTNNGVSMGINNNSYFFTITERGEEYEETSNPFARHIGWLTGWYHVPKELEV